MIGVVDLDLLDPQSTLPASLHPVHVLVWAGNEVLGAVDLPALRPLQTGMARDQVLESFGPRLRANSRVQAPGAGLDPAEITVVVCTRDRPQLLVGCLETLARLDPAPGAVLVVDNASVTPDTRDVAEAAGVRYAREARPGLNRARETGWRAAQTAVVSYVDDDAQAHPRLVGALAEGFLSGQVGAVTGLVMPAELLTPAQRAFERQGGMGKGFTREVHQLRTWRHGSHAERLGVGTNMAFRTSVLEQLGGFDPRLDVGMPTRGGGDLDMLYRTLHSGHAVVYQPGAVVRHMHRRDWQGLAAQMTDNGVAYSALLAKYEDEPQGDVDIRRARRRWHLERHLRAPLGALRRRHLGQAWLLLAEARGSRRGRAALRDAAERARTTLPGG